MRSLASGAATRPVLRRQGVLALALAVVLQLVLPSLHGFARGEGSAPAAAAARNSESAATLFAGASGPAHHADDCPQCQVFAQTRGQSVPARTVLAAPQCGAASDLPLYAAQRLPAAPKAASGGPRAPPSVFS